jgi:predicted transcriptional regulator
MCPSPYAVLDAVVTIYRERDEPVPPQAIAETLDVPADALDQPLESLRKFELIQPTGGGYRPTVTATELLELDIEFDDILILDLIDK